MKRKRIWKALSLLLVCCLMLLTMASTPAEQIGAVPMDGEHSDADGRGDKKMDCR